jgi:uroporphyrin-3 C-methyltransferase
LRQKIGLFFLLLVFLIFVCAFSYGYFQLARINVLLAHTVTYLQTRVTRYHDQLTAIQKTIDELQQTANQSKKLSVQQEQVLTELRAARKGDLERWDMAEAQYLVKLANDHLQFTHNISLALRLLKNANDILQRLPNEHLLAIRKALAVDITNVQSLTLVDTTGLYLRLSALNDLLDQLPLLPGFIKTTAPSSLAPMSTTSPWWKRGWKRVEGVLRQIVVVRYHPSLTLPLALPEEKVFLYQNLHDQFANAMWAVLHSNTDVYQASLERAQNWIKEYFLQETQKTRTVLESIVELKKIVIQPPSLNLATTTQLFDAYFTQTEKSEGTQTQ